MDKTIKTIELDKCFIHIDELHLIPERRQFMIYPRLELKGVMYLGKEVVDKATQEEIGQEILNFFKKAIGGM